MKVIHKMESVDRSGGINLFVRRSGGLLIILGGLTFFISLTGVMVTHPMTKTIHSALHLALSGGDFLLFTGFILFAKSNLKHLNLISSTGIAFSLLGTLLYIIGGFNYAIVHGLLDIVTFNDPIHQIPLNIAPNAFSIGALLTGAGALYNKSISRPTAIFLMIAAVILFVGWQQIGFNMIRFTNKSRYIKAMLVTLPIGIGLCWVGFEQLLTKPK